MSRHLWEGVLVMGETKLFKTLNQLNQLLHKMFHCCDACRSEGFNAVETQNALKHFSIANVLKCK